MIEIIVIVIGFCILSGLIWKLHPRSIAETPGYSPTVILVLDMLNDGRDWAVDKYRATHPTGASIWIANTPDTAGLSLDGAAWPDRSGRPGNVVTTKAERKALFAAAKALREKRQSDSLAEATAEWAGRVKRYADNVVNIRGAA